MLTPLDELLDREAIAGLLALASAAAGGAEVGLLDTAGRVAAGRAPAKIDTRSHGVELDGQRVGRVVGGETVPAELLAVVARALELILRGARDQADRVRVGQELSIGRRIQQALMPSRFPDLAGWTFASRYEPAREVGGDLFDVFMVRGEADQVALVIADVTGKGIPAALLMADVRALLHAAADNADGPADALHRVNSILVRERQTSLFVTAAMVVVDVSTGGVRYASAGHESPLAARYAGGVEPLDTAGPILGAFDDATFDERRTTLSTGDALVLYTDGITESRDADRAFFGEDRLLANIDRTCGQSAAEIAASLVEEVHAFRGAAEPFDDLTLLVVERRPA